MFGFSVVESPCSGMETGRFGGEDRRTFSVASEDKYGNETGASGRPPSGEETGNFSGVEMRTFSAASEDKEACWSGSKVNSPLRLSVVDSP